jgi:exodeoxyribonuclease VII large subunit
MQSTATPRTILSVSELTTNIKSLLEENFPFIWISGEISNFRKPASGHAYFTLKDERAQINAVMFRQQNRSLRFDPEDGLLVVGLGRVSVYEPRGTYQIILEYLEPKGIGELQLAYEQLKARLADEGMFDPDTKKSLPYLPRKLSVITSPTGAVIHDFITVARRRFSNLHIEVIPVKVQGAGAADEIVAAIGRMNRHGTSDVGIVARGGGSLEDLQAFNSETVARAIFASQIPIVSAVGHETDFVIADFVADLRAPTPSAAAELVIPLKRELKDQVNALMRALTQAIHDRIEDERRSVTQLSQRLVDPRKRIQDARLRLDDLAIRLSRAAQRTIQLRRERWQWRHNQLLVNTPLTRILNLNMTLKQINYNLLNKFNIIRNNKRASYTTLVSRLQALNPAAVLSRGYSIARTIPDARIVRNAATVDVGQALEVILHQGRLRCRIERKTADGTQDEF